MQAAGKANKMGEMREMREKLVETCQRHSLQQQQTIRPSVQNTHPHKHTHTHTHTHTAVHCGKDKHKYKCTLERKQSTANCKLQQSKNSAATPPKNANELRHFRRQSWLYYIV